MKDKYGNISVSGELKKSSAIIRKLVRLVRYYGYEEKLPPLREEQRKAAILRAKILEGRR